MLNDLHQRIVDALELADAAGAVDVGISLDGARVKLEETIGGGAKRTSAALVRVDGPDRLH